MKRYTFQGQEYIQIDGDWLTAAYQTPPLVVRRELQRLYGHSGQTESPPTPRNQSPRLKAKRAISLQQQLAPVIVDIIHRRFSETGQFVTRQEIVERLIERPSIHDLLQQDYEGQTHFDTFEKYIGNQIDFFSKAITEATSPYTDQFQRQKDDDKWSYCPKQPALLATNPQKYHPLG